MRARQFWFLLTAFLTGTTFATIIVPSRFASGVSIAALTLLSASIVFIAFRSLRGNRWPFIALPLTLLVSAGITGALMSNITFRWLMAGLVALSLGLFVDVLIAARTTATLSPATPDNRLLYTIGHLTLLTVFFTASGIAALATLLNLPNPLVIIIFSWMIYICGRSFTESVPHLNRHERWGVIVVLTISMLQIFVGLLALPFHFVIIGGITALAFYALAGLARTALLRSLTQSIVVRYVVGTLVAIGLILAAAQWI